MTILQGLTLLAGSGRVSKLTDFLRRVGEQAPDLKPAADEALAWLGAAAEPTNLVAIGEAIPRELLNIAQGKIEPRDSPSGAI